MAGQGVSEKAETVRGENSGDDFAKLSRKNRWNSLLLTSSFLAEKLHPAADRSEGKPPSQETEHRHVEPDANVPTAAAEEVEEETLVEPLQQVVQASEGTLHQPSQGVKVSRMSLSAVDSATFQSDSLNAKPMKEAMVATGNPCGLTSHHIE